MIRALIAALLIRFSSPKPRYFCTNCGTNEIDARANGCPRGQRTCPMGLIGDLPCLCGGAKTCGCPR